MQLSEAINSQLIDINNLSLQHFKKSAKTDHNKRYENFDNLRKRIISENYRCWIPNNSGLLRQDRTALHDEVKGRISFKPIFSKNGQPFQKIEVIDTDLNIKDYLPNLISRFTDLKNMLANQTSLSKKIDTLKEFKLDPSLKMVTYTSIEFVEKKTDSNEKTIYQEVKIGEGHTVKDGVYRGECKLLFLKPSSFSKLLKLKTREKLSSIYKSLNIIEDQIIKDKYDEVKEELVTELKSSINIEKSVELKYELEAKGRIKLFPLTVQVSPNAGKLEFENLLSKEGYKQTVQLLNSMIKKVFHGDSHHHHKDDVILKVYKSSSSDNIILDQIASHIKGLDKIESRREKIPFQKFIPYYTHEAKGVIAYATMYYENYIKNNESLKEEGSRLLQAINSGYQSLESTVARNEQIVDIKNGTNNKSILSEFGLWILFFAFSTFAYKLKDESTLFSIYIDSFMFLISQTPLFIAILVWLVIILSRNFTIKKYVHIILLHSDSRPKDKYYVWHFRDKGIINSWVVFNMFLGFCLIVLSFFLSNELFMLLLNIF